MSGEKTEDASPRRLRKAREEGRVARSQEFTGAMVTVAAFTALAVTSTEIGVGLTDLIRHCIGTAMRPDLDPSHLSMLLSDALVVLVFCLTPVLAGALAVAALVSYAQVGALFSMKPLLPDLNRMNPAEGGKKLLFTKEKLVELTKNLGKITIMIFIGYGVFVDRIGLLLRTPRLRLVDAISAFTDAAWQLARYLVAGLLIFALIDLLWTRHRFRQEMKMTKQEVRDEYKESEGDPRMKGRRKQLHRELIRDAGMRRVKTADAVVVNPTHVAAAIRYREEEMAAPTLVAAGKGEVAREIRRLARRHGIAIVRNVALAHALAEVELEEEIPEGLYEAVAEVLHFVYSLRKENR